MLRRWYLLALSLVCLVPGLVSGQARPTVPPSLEPWVPWVLHQQAYRRCPRLEPAATTPEAHACAWPGELSLSVSAGGGRFSQSWQLLAPGWVALPGDERAWPQSVQVNGRALPVITRGETPAVFLESGDHTLSGTFAWETRPAALRIPESTALVSLSVDGKTVAFPERNGQGLWLGQRPDTAGEADTTDLRVYRLMEDGSPLRLVTRLTLRVSGKAREEVLGTALPGGYVPMTLSSLLPARIEPDGRLRMQLRPGTWTVEYVARAEADPVELALPAAAASWPQQEVWTYVPDTLLRESRLLGGEPVDAEQAGVPEHWRRGASVVVDPGARLTLEERRRGGPVGQGNRLILNRTLYMDFSGEGLTAVDALEGQMREQWRLDMLAPFDLRNARDPAGDLLITRGAQPGARGVELRDSQVFLVALSRVQGPHGDLPATGWQARFDQVNTTLQLPPGFHLLAAPGVDAAVGSWAHDWTLMDLFLVLLVSVTLTRLMGLRTGLLALAVLVLLHQMMPSLAWALVNLLIAMAVTDVAPEGRLRAYARRYQWMALGVLVLLSVPFMGGLVIKALHPQLEYFGVMDMEREMPATVMQDAVSRGLVTEEHLERKMVAAEAPAADTLSRSYAPGLLVQTGPGVPDWSWNRYTLRWSGPVDADRSFSLILSPPWLTFLWRMVGVLGLVALLLLLTRRCLPRLAGGRWLRKAPAPGLAAVLALGLVCAPDQARAQFPDKALLDELQQRLLAAPDCEPSCVEVPRASLKADRGTLSLEMEVNAQARHLLPVPDAGAAWQPREIRLDGRTQSHLLVHAGVRYLLVPAGVSRLVLRGELAPRDTVQLRFPLSPRSLAVNLAGWEAEGLREGRLPAGTLQLIRQRTTGEGDAPGDLVPEQYAAFLRITRSLDLDLDWSMTTRVERLAPERGAISVAVPLLTGESVITAGQAVADGHALVNLAPEQAGVGWKSALPAGTRQVLASPVDAPWVELWRIRVGPQWRPKVSGVPAAASTGDGWVLDYYPRPGESLDLDAVQPEPAEGNTLAFDRARLTAEVGATSLRANLALEWRSSRGGEHRIRLPEGARLDSVNTDGRDLALSLESGELVLPVSPGAHSTRIAWTQAGQVGIRWNSPRVDLGSTASNLQIDARMPEDRWLLHAVGPRLGPVVLYWAQLVVFLAAAVLVSRVPHAPFPLRDWLILGLGLSTVSWGVLVVFVAWAFTLGWRDRQADLRQLPYPDVIQTGLAMFTVLTLAQLVAAIPQALLGDPDMQIRGYLSWGSSLSWFQDKTDGLLPTATVISLPLLAYKAAMLAWALWLSMALVRWVRWAWTAWARGGTWVGRVVTGEPPAGGKKKPEPGE